MLKVHAIDHIVFNVQDVEVSAAWYAEVLGMERQDSTTSDGAARTAMLFGCNKINLRPVSADEEAWFTASAPVAGSSDLCFLTALSPNEVTDHFRRSGVVIVEGPTTKSGARGPLCSVYVRDPDGNLIEVSSYGN